MEFIDVLSGQKGTAQFFDHPSFAGCWWRLRVASSIKTLKIVERYTRLIYVRSIVEYQDGRVVEYGWSGWGIYRDGAPSSPYASDGNTAMAPEVLPFALDIKFKDGADVLEHIANIATN